MMVATAMAVVQRMCVFMSSPRVEVAAMGVNKGMARLNIELALGRPSVMVM